MDFLKSQVVGATGYLYVVSPTGTVIFHPNNEMIGSDLSQNELFKKQKAIGASGYVEYMWKNPGESQAREKSLAQETFEPWNWIIAATAYKEEFYKIVKSKVEESIKERIASIKIGQTGYVYVIKGQGEEKGHYVVSFER